MCIRDSINAEYMGEAHQKPVKSIGFSPNGQIVASGSEDNTIILWNIESYQQVKILDSHKNWVWQIAFSNDGKLMASGSTDQTIKLWDPNSFQLINTYSGHANTIFCLIFSPDQRFLISGSRDKTVRIWSVETFIQLQVIYAHDAWIRTVQMTPDGKRLLTGAEDSTIRIWAIESNLVVKEEIADDKTQQMMEQKENNFRTTPWISSQIPQMILLLQKLSDFEDSKIKDYIHKNKNFTVPLNLSSHGYYYYYIEQDQRKIPLINFLLYLDEIKLTETYLKLLEWTPDIQIPLGKDQYGITPFNIVHKRQLLTFDIFIKFCVSNNKKIPVLDFDVDSILQLFPKENLTQAAAELIDSQFIDIPLNNITMSLKKRKLPLLLNQCNYQPRLIFNYLVLKRKNFIKNLEINIFSKQSRLSLMKMTIYPKR
eukprot:TRINITY_DN2428_c0_g1_i6.p1 TRINITY_DN2428_c0_g1~~TRINITY_DN2428_c0_g1_i6.p1  ORF type:complete len:426 (+),score=42.35 TRINITY_DN2428_c0_g1_i6:150-1427(+)